MKRTLIFSHTEQSPYPSYREREREREKERMDQTLSQILTSQFARKVTKLVLLSVSLFSFFISSYSTLWHSFFMINSFSLIHFSTFSFKLLCHAVDKNCIFLICNGILVFLAKSSGFFIRFSPENELHDPLLNEADSLLDREGSAEEQEERQDSLAKTEASNFKAEEKEQEEKKVAHERKTKEKNVLLITTAEEEEEENKLGAIGVGIEEGRGKGMVISTEELNKKCDEFIRRMHEEIRIGAM